MQAELVDIAAGAASPQEQCGALLDDETCAEVPDAVVRQSFEAIVDKNPRFGCRMRPMNTPEQRNPETLSQAEWPSHEGAKVIFTEFMPHLMQDE